MELAFTKIDGLYIAEFQVSADFNLHIERDETGPIILYQRTTSQGEYDYVKNFGFKQDGDKVMDLDFQSLVYPKWIKIKSAVNPLVATITTDGEVNEVVYQAKEIEITSNGTTKVTADTGYTALASVNVKVNVPTEGGGKSDGSDWHYFDIRGVEMDDTLMYTLTIAIIKSTEYETNELSRKYAIAPFIYAQMEGSDSLRFKEFGVNLNQKMFLSIPTSIFEGTLKEFYEIEGIDILNRYPEITKEQFYSLDNIWE